MYISYRLLRFKDEVKSELAAVVRENCASRDSFKAHELFDNERFAAMERAIVAMDKAIAARHLELRHDTARVEVRLDSIIAKIG